MPQPVFGDTKSPTDFDPADEGYNTAHDSRSRVQSMGKIPSHSAGIKPGDIAGLDLSDDGLGNATPSEIADIYEMHDAIQQGEDPSVDEEVAVMTVLDLLEEARAEGLCHDTFLDHPFASARMPTPPDSAADDLDQWPGLEVDQRVAAFDLVDHGEKWDVDRESAEFLASVIAFGKADDRVFASDDSPTTFTDLKMDEPILQCDPHVEVQKLKDRNAVELSTQGLELFALDREKGESVCWAITDLHLPMLKDNEVASERFEVSEDVVTLLRNIAQPSPVNYAEMFACLIEVDKPRILEPQTPPLLPLSPPLSPIRPPASLLEMQLTSTPEDLMATEAAEMEREIMRFDELSSNASDAFVQTQETGIGAVDMHTTVPMPAGNSSLPGKLKRIEDAKVDVPLLPNSADQSSPENTQAGFPDEVRSLLPLPESDLSILDPEVAEHHLHAFVSDIVTPFARRAVEQVGNEQLLDFDTTIRMAVPHVDNTPPIPPWLQYHQQHNIGSQLESPLVSQRRLLSFTRREMMKGETGWSGVSKLERTLGWSPFPARLGKVKLDEAFDDDGSSARYMADLDMNDEIDIGGLIAKAAGLRILDSQEDDENEIEPTEFDIKIVDDGHPIDGLKQQKFQLPSFPPNPVNDEQATIIVPVPPVPPSRIDMQTLLRKRKQELESTSKSQDVSLSLPVVGAHQMPAAKKPRLQEGSSGGLEVGGLLNHAGIAGFMQLQGSKVTSRPPVDGHVMAREQAAAPSAVMIPPAEELTTASEHLLLPSPHIADPERTMQVVVSSNVLANRTLIRQLHALLPGLEIIERAPVHHESRNKKDSKGSLQHIEADLTLSPSAGLLTTTLQQLKQKPLPGQTGFFGVRERIAAVSMRYERLIVLVLHAQSLDRLPGSIVGGLAERDCDALCDLMAFSASLETDVEVRIVPGSGEDIAKWIAAAISQQSTAVDDGTQLLSDETLWERFLRAAGLNAFAAQVILSLLKQPEGKPGMASSSAVQDSDSEAFGLAAFVRLSLEQRLQQFGPVLSGVRVLGRVNEVLAGGLLRAAAMTER
ncbi:hypothetical protein LTR91_025916 [Friedmanniomyces endolithicus]|uniref:Uncharacterized protein n=1 Tax=Friedmanniomyces endolithicus TaxID=329885 RepID=A0AAN6GXW3_9PEZI|nr:hypothetical protein LTR94_022987 [Friedmanniomyces endolithicus]KAK0788690.1 hypothetical protein LTR59_009884 [Friedmanniomyces endolithicus]KAK0806572.1 hypothetical protein LTR75_006898 [Friedmanniomyces endolithicus]KAK0817449.1 hypothetical protein LTR38_001527 [Friedmanniomyces endolithicus]KAK0823506.1 hypothetical protein LTR03_017933 [Friedmanniomyces endolithicus]